METMYKGEEGAINNTAETEETKGEHPSENDGDTLDLSGVIGGLSIEDETVMAYGSADDTESLDSESIDETGEIPTEHSAVEPREKEVADAVRDGAIYVDGDDIPCYVVNEIVSVQIGDTIYKCVNFLEIGTGRPLSMALDTFHRFMRMNGCRRFVDRDAAVADYLETVAIQDGYLYTADEKPYIETVESMVMFEDRYEGDPFKEFANVRKVIFYDDKGNEVVRCVREGYLKRVLFRYSDQFEAVRNDFGMTDKGE